MIVRTRRIQGVPNIITQLWTLSKGEIMKEVCKQRLLIGISCVGKVMSPMQRIRETCTMRLTNWRRSCVARRRRSSLGSESSSKDTEDATYRQRSRTPPSETFSGDEEYGSHRRKNKSPSHKGLGNKAMNEALNQVVKSPFIWRIEGASLPRRFNQPTFSLYNGRTDPVEHVSHFNQRMVVHSKDEALMCKIFPSSLGPMAMRWFDGLKANSIDSFKKLT